MQHELIHENQHEINQLAKELMIRAGEETDPREQYLLQALQFAVDSNLEGLNRTLAEDIQYRQNWILIHNKIQELGEMTPKEQMAVFADQEGWFWIDPTDTPEKALYELINGLMGLMIQRNELPY